MSKSFIINLDHAYSPKTNIANKNVIEVVEYGNNILEDKESETITGAVNFWGYDNSSNFTILSTPEVSENFSVEGQMSTKFEVYQTGLYMYRDILPLYITISKKASIKYSKVVITDTVSAYDTYSNGIRSSFTVDLVENLTSSSYSNYYSLEKIKNYNSAGNFFAVGKNTDTLSIRFSLVKDYVFKNSTAGTNTLVNKPVYFNHSITIKLYEELPTLKKNLKSAVSNNYSKSNLSYVLPTSQFANDKTQYNSTYVVENVVSEILKGYKEGKKVVEFEIPFQKLLSDYDTVVFDMLKGQLPEIGDTFSFEYSKAKIHDKDILGTDFTIIKTEFSYNGVPKLLIKGKQV